MATFIFNNKEYSINESSLTPAVSELKSYFSTVINGTGATINFDGTSYNVDSSKLASARNIFVSHLGTIAGNGSKVVVDGVEYSVDSTKVQSAISELETAFGGSGGAGVEAATFTVAFYNTSGDELSNETFSFEEGMTWTEFIASDYNTDNRFTIEEYPVYFDGKPLSIHVAPGDVMCDEVVTAGTGVYWIYN